MDLRALRPFSCRCRSYSWQIWEMHFGLRSQNLDDNFERINIFTRLIMPLSFMSSVSYNNRIKNFDSWSGVDESLLLCYRFYFSILHLLYNQSSWSQCQIVKSDLCHRLLSRNKTTRMLNEKREFRETRRISCQSILSFLRSRVWRRRIIAWGCWRTCTISVRLAIALGVDCRWRHWRRYPGSSCNEKGIFLSLSLEFHTP